MAEQSAGVDIDDDVVWLTEQIEALKRLGEQPEVTDGQRYDLSIRWGTALAGRLPRLMHYSSHGLLDDADEHRFQDLCAELRELDAVIERLGFTQPVMTPRRDSTLARSRRGRRSHRG